MHDPLSRDEPCYAISIVSRMVGVHAQTLRYYERAGLIRPSRSKGRVRLYSQIDVERLAKIRRLTDDLGLNLAGVEIILRMTDHMAELEERIALLISQLDPESET